MATLIVIALLGAVLAAFIASSKRRNGMIWGAAGFLFPLIAVIAVVCLPALPDPDDPDVRRPS